MSKNTETAILAGGCYWIMQQLLRAPAGVISTRVGWTGGHRDNPSEAGSGGHAEAVEVTFDRGRLSYRKLLEYFFLVHRPDPGADVVGSIYRSEIYYLSDEQRVTAEEVIRAAVTSGKWPSLATRVTKASRFWQEAPEEQDYLQRIAAG